MSGSGGGQPPPTADPCEKLTSKTTLTSPVKDVVAQLTKGVELEIELKKSGGARVIQALHRGRLAGSITSTVIQRIAECIEDGHKYVAEVLSVEGGSCQVLVRHK